MAGQGYELGWQPEGTSLPPPSFSCGGSGGGERMHGDGAGEVECEERRVDALNWLGAR